MIAPAEYGVCRHGTPLNMTCGPCGRILPGANEAALLASTPTRYRIHGEVGSQSGRTYQVDLVVEAMP